MTTKLKVSAVDASTRRGIGGVAVTCGDGIARTAADGSCQIDYGAHDRFVWITCPERYRAEGGFYRPLPAGEGVVFELADEPRSQAGVGGVRLAQFTDTHVVGADQRVSATELSQALARLTAEAAPDLLVASGDLTNLGSPEELTELQAGLADVKTPLFLMFGGHDGNAERRVDGNEPPWTRNWEGRFGPTYYSFDWGGRHIVLWPNEDGFFAPHERERKRRWLDDDLALHADRGNTILVTHLPPSAAFVDDMGGLGVTLILHGHWHSMKVHCRGGVTVAATPPLCFGGIDTSPRGYRLVQWGVSEELITTRLAALGASDLTPRAPAVIGDFRLTWARDMTKEEEDLSLSHRASPLAVGDRLYLAGSKETSGVIRCLCLATGETRWSVSTESPVRNSPRAAADRVLALAMTGALYCIDADGQVDWRREIVGHPDRWLYTRPAVGDGVVYAGGKSGMGAYDLQTGKVRWYTSIEASDAWSSYASPILAQGLVVQLVARRGIVALAQADGAIVWEAPLDVEYQYAEPVLLDDDLITGGARSQLARLRVCDGELVWHHDVLKGEYAAALSVDETHIYTASPSGSVQAFEPLSGKQLWGLQTGADLLDMTPYAHGVQSILATPTVVGAALLVGANDGFLRVVDRTTGEVSAQADFGAPLTSAPIALDDGGFVLPTWDGRVLRYDPA
jgi:outer membrane protein assembly factor BamB/predicted MPP superfamily phosphohydrolase